MDYPQSIEMYDNLIKRMPDKQHVTIIYVSGAILFGRQDLLSGDVFDRHGFDIITSYHTGSLFLRRYIVIAERDPTSLK